MSVLFRDYYVILVCVQITAHSGVKFVQMVQYKDRELGYLDTLENDQLNSSIWITKNIYSYIFHISKSTSNIAYSII